MNFDIDQIIKEIEMRQSPLIDMDYLKDVSKRLYEYSKTLKVSKKYEELIKVYYLLGLEMTIKSSIYESIKYWNKSLELSIKNNNKLWEAKCYSRLSVVNLKIKNYKESRRFFIKAIKLLKELKNIEEITVSYVQRLVYIRWHEKDKFIIKSYINKILNLMKLYKNNSHGYYYIDIAITYVYFLHEEIKGMKNLINSMKIGEKNNMLEINALVLYYQGTIYLDKMNNVLEAIRHLEPLIDKEKYSFLNKELKCSALVALIEAYIEDKRLQGAKYCIDYVKEYIHDINNVLDESTKIMLNYLEVKIMLENNENLIICLQEALNIQKRYKKMEIMFKYTHFDYNINTLIGDIYFKLKDYNKSIEYYNKSILMSEKWGKEYEKNAYYSLANVYEDKGDYENAFKNYKISETIFKEMIKEQSFIKYENMQKEFENIYKEEEIKSLSIFNEKIKEESYNDDLSKLFNRFYLEDIVKNNINVKNVYVALIDIDYFKNYNDNYGHIKGDCVLINVAQCIKDSCKECSDKIIRYGGEEFLIISYSDDKEHIKNIAYKIIENIKKLNIEHKYSLTSDKITVSIGLSIGNVNNKADYDKLIDKADKALYMAKNNGRNTAVKYIDNK